MDRISIGFAAGQVLSLRVEDNVLKALLGAVDTDSAGWYAVDSDDGPVKLRLDSVVYVRAESKESKVGFGI